MGERVQAESNAPRAGVAGQARYRRGAVAFLTFHDGYHTGQIAYVRKWLGKGQLVG